MPDPGHRVTLAEQSCTGKSMTCHLPLIDWWSSVPLNTSRSPNAKPVLSQPQLWIRSATFLGSCTARISWRCTNVSEASRWLGLPSSDTLRGFCGSLLQPRAVAGPLLCGLIGKVPIIVTCRAVDELADDVGMPRVPSNFCRDIHHDLLQGDLLAIRRPPRNSARRFERERLDSGVCMCCGLLIERDDVFPRLFGRRPHIRVDLSTFVKPWQRYV